VPDSLLFGTVSACLGDAFETTGVGSEFGARGGRQERIVFEAHCEAFVWLAGVPVADMSQAVAPRIAGWDFQIPPAAHSRGTVAANHTGNRAVNKGVATFHDGPDC
jgi:hypothetical protein